MSTTPNAAGRPMALGRITLEYPMSLGVYDKYEDAQKVVDFLSDKEFPVQDVMIVGTDLRQVERVTGRLTRGRAIGAGAMSGAWLGLFVGTIFALFSSTAFDILQVISTVIFGVIFGAIWAAIGYRLTGGQRDFMSVTQIVATRYEVLCEHKHIQQGRDLLNELDPMRAAQEQIRQAQEAARAAATPAAQQAAQQPAQQAFPPQA